MVARKQHRRDTTRQPKREKAPLQPHNYACPPISAQPLDRMDYRKGGLLNSQYYDNGSEGSDSCFSRHSTMFHMELDVVAKMPMHQPEVLVTDVPRPQAVTPEQKRSHRRRQRNQALTEDGFDAILSQLPDVLSTALQ
mmetsp:Transcript_33741/g.70142  ORF Transcript_33741/g.70142 Transcript_33741/m.70142 type:complete len:138 (-) Transcript_33741:378-791(-)|eukprot:CAMPEP_0172449836 /NCGR_PEP_ID=MMETSP1065-20121228/8432_1 /TAXON_ID=265537 /ORGANISM="Amphiprora paludosa, Strain CCMP125" /LENGTH=137 /DNA_ID=CAMNT_0013201589 /DNA_START=92 /DNA_END=505 /DNA_ORIENTATION=-